MKYITLTFLMFISYQISFAQWTTSGTNIYNSNTGNTGIGVTAPQSKLEVNGSLRTTGNSPLPTTGQGLEFLYQPSPALSIITSFDRSGATNLPLSFRSSAFDFTGGNIGFGTTSPNAKLEALGTTEQIRLSYDATKYSSFTTSSAGNLTITPIGGIATINANIIGGFSASNFYIPASAISGVFAVPQYQFASSTANSLRVGFYGFAGTLTANTNYSSTIFAGAPLTTSSTGTHGWLANLVVKPLSSVTSGGSAITNTASLYIDGASTIATKNYAIYSNTGSNYFGGNVCINTTDGKGYQFAVNGSAIATSMTVKLNANWPDYVFKPDYQLAPLQEVKAFIDKNHHLSEMPSEQQIAKEGLNLGEINTLLTKKVEELTLYLIESDKKQNEQENALKHQQEEIQQLKQQMQLLIKTAQNK